MVLSWRVTITDTLLFLVNVTGEADEVTVGQALLWTPAVIAAYEASIAESES